MQVLLHKSSSGSFELEHGALAAVRATINAISLNGSENPPSDVSRDGEPYAVLPSTIDAGSLVPSVQDYLKQLTQSANSAAASLACGSILAGHTSEADEYGDIAVWLGSGDYGAGHELDVLSALGLERVAAQGRVQEVKLSPKTGLPTTVNISADANPAFARLRELLQSLKDVRVFSIQGDLCVYLLLGRYESDHESSIAGLLGLGVQS